MAKLALTAQQTEWHERVERWINSGLGRDAFAARESVEPKRLRWWHWNLRRLGVPLADPPGRSPSRARPTSALSLASSFVRLDAIPAAVPAPGLELLFGLGRVIRVPVGFDAATLGRLIAVVEESAS